MVVAPETALLEITFSTVPVLAPTIPPTSDDTPGFAVVSTISVPFTWLIVSLFIPAIPPTKLAFSVSVLPKPTIRLPKVFTSSIMPLLTPATAPTTRPLKLPPTTDKFLTAPVLFAPVTGSFALLISAKIPALPVSPPSTFNPMIFLLLPSKIPLKFSMALKSLYPVASISFFKAKSCTDKPLPLILANCLTSLIQVYDLSCKPALAKAFPNCS